VAARLPSSRPYSQHRDLRTKTDTPIQHSTTISTIQQESSKLIHADPFSTDTKMLPLRVKIISDLHLKTPLMSPYYDHYSRPENFSIHAPNLLLLSAISLTQHPQLSIPNSPLKPTYRPANLPLCETTNYTTQLSFSKSTISTLDRRESPRHDKSITNDGFRTRDLL
jgi:hypothetical protein